MQNINRSKQLIFEKKSRRDTLTNIFEKVIQKTLIE